MQANIIRNKNVKIILNENDTHLKIGTFIIICMHVNVRVCIASSKWIHVKPKNVLNK